MRTKTAAELEIDCEDIKRHNADLRKQRAKLSEQIITGEFLLAVLQKSAKKVAKAELKNK